MITGGTEIEMCLKFLWAGLIFGLIYLFCKFIVRLSRKNLYITNVVMFCYWLLFGGTFALYCMRLNNFSFTFAGLLSMVAGFILVKISIDFFFTKFCKLIYNGFVKLRKRKSTNVNLRTNEKD